MMRNKGWHSFLCPTLRVLIPFSILAVSAVMFLTSRPVVSGFRIPQKRTAFGRALKSWANLESSPCKLRPTVPTLNRQKGTIRSTRWHQNLDSGVPSYSTSLFQARRSVSAASSSKKNLPPVSPVVEISPSSHGTSPLKTFDSDLGGNGDAVMVDERILKKLKQMIGANAKPTPIQANAIPLLLDGNDVMASSPTGSGKSIMFGLPLLQKLILSQKLGRGKYSGKNNGGNMGTPRALVISPTRELALQTANVLKSFVVPRNSKADKQNSAVALNVCLATGGSDLKNQRQQLPSCDVLVGTPGRILQFSDDRKLSLGSVEYLVVDEADRLLDMGFEPQLTRIARSLGRRKGGHTQQSILCSATFPAGVQRLAADFLLPDYYFVSVGRVGSTHANIRQHFEWVNAFYANPQNRRNANSQNNNNRSFDPKESAVVRNVQRFWEETSGSKSKQPNVIVFTNTKDGAEKYGKALTKLGSRFKAKKVRVIHGDKPQSERNRAIQDFKSGRATTLVATDVAARGLDISTIGLVVQADAPRNIDTYTHRVGRTGRAGASGEAITLLDAKSGFGIATGLVDLLQDAEQVDSIPSWLRGMAYVANARKLEEELAIQAGTAVYPENNNNNEGVITNEEFTGQDFRRTAVEGSYGAGRDTSYRSFDEEAYSSKGDISVSSTQTATTEEESTMSLETQSDGQHMDLESKKEYVEEPIIEPENEATAFQRQRPSRRLLDAIKEYTGSTELDVPNKSLIDSLSKKGGGNQKLKFEYFGMFPFETISPFLVSQSSESNNDKAGENRMPRVLMVAEKPSIAKAMAEALSGRKGPRQRRGISRALPVYEFISDSFQPINKSNGGKPSKCLITVTSVVGHIFSLGFDNQNQTQSVDPQDYFHLPVVKQEESTSSKLRVIDHLRALAGESDHLVLWLDCDPEGENIAHEVMAITRQAINNNNHEGENRIHRAQFSAISAEALRDAFGSLGEPDSALSRAVDARQELDLRIGVALTRLLTWRCVGIARKRFGPATRVISYGPCQTPALSFCVNRAREIEEFEREPYWKVDIEVGLPNGAKSAQNSFPLSWKVPKEDAVIDTRRKLRKNSANKDIVESTLDCASFNMMEADRIVQLCASPESHLVVQKVREKAETIPPPLGLNTVALLEAGSKSMGMSPKQVMNVAEKLYSAGFISYPRTETTKYDPNGFDVRHSLRHHAGHPDWGRTASYLLRTKYSNTGKPPMRGRDVGDHPPITPLKSATRNEVGGGAAWRVYEFVVRNFLGSLHNELSFTRRTISMDLPNSANTDKGWLGFGAGSESDFELELVSVDSLGFTDCCRWVLRDIGASGNKEKSSILLKKGDTLPITKAKLETALTKPPRFLQEHELILLMDEKNIGTDASMAVHVSNIVDRGYVKLCDETGQPLRGPRRPGSKPIPRQIGRYMVPTALGMELLDIFERDDRFLQAGMGKFDKESPALLSHPSIRRQMEEEVKQIARGTIEKEYCLEKNLDWFEERYLELEQSLDRKRIKEFGKSLTSRKDDMQFWKALGAFEPKKATPPFSPKKKKKRPNSQSKKKIDDKNGRKTRKSSGVPSKSRRKNSTKKARVNT